MAEQVKRAWMDRKCPVLMWCCLCGNMLGGRPEVSQDRRRVVKCCEFTKDTVGKTVHMFDMLI